MTVIGLLSVKWQRIPMPGVPPLLHVFKGASEAMTDAESDPFCTAQVNSDEDSVSLVCEDGLGAVAFKGDEDGHAKKRVCRTHLDGDDLTGRCLDMEEVEDTSGESPVMTATNIKAAKLQATTWEGFLFKTPEVKTLSDGAVIGIFYKNAEVGVGESILPAATESHPENITGVAFQIVDGGPRNGDICSFQGHFPVCFLGGEGSTNTCKIEGEAPGTCRVALTISSDDFVDKRIVREVAVKNLQNATWEGFQDSEGNSVAWVRATETVSPASLGSPDGTVEQQFSLNSLLVSNCQIDSDTGVVTADALDLTGACFTTMTVTSADYMTKIFRTGVTVYGDSAIAGLNNIVWPANPYGAGPVLNPGRGSLPLESEPTAVQNPNQPTRTLDFTYRSRDTAICTVDADTAVVTAVKNGDCVIEARELGTSTIPASLWVAIGTPLAVTTPSQNAIGLTGFAYSATSVTFGGTAPTLTAPTPNPSDAALSYTVTGTSQGCNVDSNGALTLTGVGTCIVRVTARKDAHDDTSDIFSITINPATMSLSGMSYSANSVNFGEDPPTLSTAPTPSQAGAAIAYAAADTSVGCDVGPSDGALTLTGVGTCIVKATATKANYVDATETYSITIGPGNDEFL